VIAERSRGGELELERGSFLHPLLRREGAVVGHHVVIGLEQRPVVVGPPHEVADVYDELRGVELVPA